MRRPLIGLLSAFLLLNACHAPTGTTAVSTKSKKAAAVPSARASTAVRASAPPLAVPSPAPSVDGQLLAGLLKMDASFVVAAGGGNVIAAGGGNVIAAGGGNLIQVGGQVIAAGGGNVIAPGGGNYRVLATPALGEMLPASGMAVVAMSLRTGKPISEAVLTDAQGRYQLHIPRSETGNVRIVAAVPAKTKDDPVLANPQLQSELLAPAKAATEQVMDDDRSMVSKYFRTAFIGRLDDLIAHDTGGAASTGNALVDALWNDLQAVAKSSGVRSLPAGDRKALAARMADCLISYVDLQSAKSDQQWPNWTAPKDELAFDAYTTILGRCRTSAIAKLQATPTFFDQQDYITKEHPAWVGKIRRPTDYSDFVVTEYLSKASNESELIPPLTSLGVDAQEAYHAMAAGNGLRMAIGLTLITNPASKQALIDLMNAAGKKSL